MDKLQLLKKVQRVQDIFPWYKQLLADNGLDKKDINSLLQLPLITSELLEQHYYSGTLPFEPREHVTSYRTSGTSSLRRKTIYYSAEDEQHYLDLKSELFQHILHPLTRTTALSDMGTGHAANTALTVFERIGIKADSIAYQQPIEQHLERLRETRPHILYTMPSILDRLLSASVDDPASYGVQHIILVGEIASPAWLESVAERMQLAEENITDTYGSIEIGTIAYYSHERGRYLFVEGIEAEGLPVEVLFPEMEPLNDQESVLVLTSQSRDLFPALRYVTYDIVRDLQPIFVQGQWRQSFKALVRRIGSELKHGEKISVYDIEDVVYRYLKDASVKIHVQSNRLTVHIDSANKDPLIYEQIKLELLDRIPEIGMMIRGGILSAMRVIPSEITFDKSVLKHKRVFYD
ncbi:phenylacetate--CoA ligase family protein [Cohnella abietis]|uniref:Coenzyme F390 synthetase n=1 Tax=Cohnella abietis TaxID=2507935 RepID=A0A3T1CZ53_9BACL|nr:CoF synthetase [Cohnella abietis]BBI31049.1 hypothetical protein KCTCHS21_04480 [Cohnella abietis]